MQARCMSHPPAWRSKKGLALLFVVVAPASMAVLEGTGSSSSCCCSNRIKSKTQIFFLEKKGKGKKMLYIYGLHFLC